MDRRVKSDLSNNDGATLGGVIGQRRNNSVNEEEKKAPPIRIPGFGTGGKWFSFILSRLLKCISDVFVVYS